MDLQVGHFDTFMEHMLFMNLSANFRHLLFSNCLFGVVAAVLPLVAASRSLLLLVAAACRTLAAACCCASPLVAAWRRVSQLPCATCRRLLPLVAVCCRLPLRAAKLRSYSQSPRHAAEVPRRSANVSALPVPCRERFCENAQNANKCLKYGALSVLRNGPFLDLPEGHFGTLVLTILKVHVGHFFGLLGGRLGAGF